MWILKKQKKIESIHITQHTLPHLHQAQQLYCFLSESWPVGKSQSGDRDTSQKHVDTTLSANQAHRSNQLYKLWLD